MDKSSIAQIAGILPDYLTMPLLYIIRYYFYKNFLGFKMKMSFYILTSLFLFLFSMIINNSTHEIWGILICNILLLIVIQFLCYGNFIIKLYAVILENVVLLLTNLCTLPFSFWINPIINTIGMSFSKHIFVNFIQNLILCILDYVILYILLKKINCYLKLKNRNLNLYQSLYLLTPCLSNYGLAFIFFLLQRIDINNHIYYLPDVAPKMYYILLPFICLLLLISLPITAYTFKVMIESEEQKHKAMLVEQQFTLQLNHFKNIDSIYLGIRKVIHDMNNHISCLKSLADANNLKEIKKYIHNMSDTVENLNFKIKTGNPICDAVINEKYNIAQAEGMEFLCDFMLPEKAYVKSIDLCILLSNALDNSIEACRKITESSIKKKISIKSYLRGLYFIIEISNSNIEPIKYSGNMVLSTKPNKINHGIGLSNIQDVVNKYNGVLDIIEERNYFTISIMLKIN